MAATRLLECAMCDLLVHAARESTTSCPECGGHLAVGLRDVGFDDARHIYGAPGAPFVAKESPAAAPPKAGKLRCADGHRVRSKPERIVDDWLHAQGILHELEPRLQGMRPDWRVGNVYIEMWGLAGQQGYEERREEKLALYRKRKLRLVELFPDDLGSLEEKLGFLRTDPASRMHL